MTGGPACRSRSAAWGRWVGVGALLLLAAPGAGAQSPAGREIMAAFRDSLQTTSDSAALSRLESRLIDVARVERDSTLLHIRLGLVALRLADLGSRSRYEDAASEFEWAVDLAPDWPWPWYGLGRAEMGLGSGGYSLLWRIQAVFRVDHLTAAAGHFTRAVELDSTFVPATVALAEALNRQRLNADPANALRLMRRTAVTDAGRGDAAFQLAWARLERIHGSADTALAAFARYERLGGDPAVARLERGRTLLLLDRPGGMVAWYAAAAGGDSTGRDGLLADIDFIATDSERTALAGARGDALVDALHRFWNRRAARSLRQPAERMAEHYRRLYYARAHFVRGPTRRRYGGPEFYESSQEEFDDRGELWIRHGPPDVRIVNQGGDCSSESWRYDTPDDPIVLHFRASRDALDFRLVASAFDLTCSSLENIILTRLTLDPVYRDIATTGESSARIERLRNREYWRGRDGIKQGTTSDDYLPDFDGPLPATARVTTVGRAPGGTRVHVTWAVGSGHLEPAATPDGGVEYPVRLRLALLGKDTSGVILLDTLNRLRAAAPVAPGNVLVGRAEVVAPAGTFEYRLALEEGARGGVFPTGKVEVERSDGTTFAMSDLVLGSRAIPLTWEPTRGDTVFFNPLGTFRRDGAIELYYELYGLVPGEACRTELTVTRAGGGGFLGLFGKSRPIRLRYDERADGRVTRVRRTIALERLRPGRYTLEVKATRPDGAQRSRSESFVVMSSGDGGS